MLETKDIIFFLGSAVCVPAGILASIYSRKFHDFIFMFLVFGTTQPDSLFGLPTDINFLSREWYRGTTRGIEISYLDLLAIILLISSIVIRSRERRRSSWPPSLGFQIAFFGWCAVNVAIFSDPKIFGLFELTKVARGIVIFIAAYLYVRGPRELRIFVWALTITMFYEAGVCLTDRYIYGRYRIQGTLGHPNSLSMYCLQCLPIFMAMAFTRSISTRQRNLSFLALIVTAGCILLTISRTGFFALIIVSVLGFALFAGLKFTPRNIAITALGLLILTLMVAKAWDTTMDRLGGTDLREEYFTDEGDRGSYFRQAAPALRDHPVTGIGLNNWSYWMSNRYSNVAGYPSAPYPSLTEAPPPGGLLPQDAPAHNLYLITATELGYPGLLLLILIFLRWLYLTGIAMLSHRNELIDRIRQGVFLSLCGMLMQSWTEWEYRQTPMFFLTHICMGAVAALVTRRS